MIPSLRDLCSPLPASIARPPSGSGLQRTCEAIEESAAAEPATTEACRAAARRAFESRPAAGRRPSARNQAMASELQILRLTVAMLRQLTEVDQGPAAEQREALAVMLTVRLYMMCGGQSLRPGAHEGACDSVAKAFGPGISADDVGAAVSKFFEAAGRLGSQDAYLNDRPAFMRQLSATLGAADDFLLAHTAWIGQAAAADEAAADEARYQPVFGDLDG